jgi:hypothetical protein
MIVLISINGCVFKNINYSNVNEIYSKRDKIDKIQKDPVAISRSLG